MEEGTLASANPVAVVEPPVLPVSATRAAIVDVERRSGAQHVVAERLMTGLELPIAEKHDAGVKLMPDEHVVFGASVVVGHR